MTNPVELMEFVHARLDDDERIALAAAHGEGAEWHSREGYVYSSPFYTPVGLDDIETGTTVVYDEGCPSWQEAEHIARHDPKRVLYDVATKRLILSTAGSVRVGPIARMLAAAYSDHPDYRKEWNQ